MLKVHHLNHSRSQRILFIAEEAGVDYEIVHHMRNKETRLAPDSLKEIHPLGKAPVIQDGSLVIAESGAAVDYIARTYGDGRLAPEFGTPDYWKYNELMNYVEGSAALPLILKLYVGRLGDAGAPLHPRINSEIALHLSYLAGVLGDNPYFMGADFSAVDAHMSFIMEATGPVGALDQLPNLKAYLERLENRPAYKQALERGGEYNLFW